MSQPPKYERTKDFTENFGSETDHSALNAELDAASNSINDIRHNLGLIQADDGKMRQGAITPDTLDQSLKNYLIEEATQGAMAYSGIAQAAAAEALAHESNAATSANAAAASASAATGKASEASASATAAANAAGSAGASASAASASEATASAAASTATASKNAAATSEANALTHKNAASASAGSAAASESNALASKNAASTSATNAQASASNAATSETNAANSASAAAASAASVNDANIVHKTGNETISGIKTFSDGIVVASLNGGPLSGMRNRIINGDFSVSQYYGDATTTPTASGYVIDRWRVALNQPSKLTFQRVSDAPAGFKYSLKISVLSKYAPSAGDYFTLEHRIEGSNVIDFSFGRSGALQVTFSEKIKGGVPGTYSVAISNASYTRSIVGTINVTTLWEPVKITFPGDANGAWLTDAGIGLILRFDLGSGSNYVTPAKDVWQDGNHCAASGSIQLVNQVVGSSLQITGVQLEPGPVATPFERVEYGEMLRRCQRYFFASGVIGTLFSGQVNAGVTYSSSPFRFPVTMRVVPTVTLTNQNNNSFSTSTGSVAATVDAVIEDRTANTTAAIGYFRSSVNASAEL